MKSVLKRLTKKRVHNQLSEEKFNEAKVIDGSPNGIFNFNETNHMWATKLYLKMKDRTWFPNQVDISKDVVNYQKLSPEKKRAYDLVLAQLISNDSIQSNQLADRINPYITSPIINACLITQAMEEVNHSYSYAVMAEDVAKDTQRIYTMSKHDEELARKNLAVENMYEVLFEPDASNPLKRLWYDFKYKKLHIEYTPSKEDMLLACAANQVLEELVFPGGFVVIHSLEDDLPGSSSMIAEIQKDETLSHVELFKRIFRQIVTEEFDNKVPENVKERIYGVIKNIVKAEKRWTKYVSKGLPGFSGATIDIFVEGKGNSVCKNLLLEPLYPKYKYDPLDKLLKAHLKGGLDSKKSKTNFFERNVADYSNDPIEYDI